MKEVKEPWMSVMVERVVNEAKPLASNARAGVDMFVIRICFDRIIDWISCMDFSSNFACVMMQKVEWTGSEMWRGSPSTKLDLIAELNACKQSMSSFL
jgi:hypothetical protein